MGSFLPGRESPLQSETPQDTLDMLVLRVLARQSRTPPGWFLGVVIAHELAHVLRPDAGHAENGLMGATLRPEAMPMFTAQEAQALRARLHDGVTVTALGAR